MNKKNDLFFKIFLICLFVIICYLPQINANDQVELCRNLKFLDILKYIRLAITIIKIVVPILLLVLCSITLVKGITAGDEKNISDVWHQIKNKVIASVLVFLVPTIFTTTLDIIGGDNNCVSNARASLMSNIARVQINKILDKGIDQENIDTIKALLLYNQDKKLENTVDEQIALYKKIMLLPDYKIAKDVNQILTTGVNENNVDSLKEMLPLLVSEDFVQLKNNSIKSISNYNKVNKFLEIARQEIGKNNKNENYKYTFGLDSDYDWCAAFVTYCLYILNTNDEERYDIPFIFDPRDLWSVNDTKFNGWFKGVLNDSIDWLGVGSYARSAATRSSNDNYFTNDDTYFSFAPFCYNRRKNSRGNRICSVKDGTKNIDCVSPYIPKTGDIIIFTYGGGCSYDGGTNTMNHIGIVESVNLQNNTVTYIDGNSTGGDYCGECISGSCVCRSTILLNADGIGGYIVWVN